MSLHYVDDVIPQAFVTPTPLTLEQYTALIPEKLEIVEGYLIDGPGDSEARQKLLAALLVNCGLDQAVELVDPFFWYDALDRMYGGHRG
jgi:hypothetical protein